MENQAVKPLKLHPMTLLQRVILSLPGFAALLLATWQSPDEGNLASLVVTALYTVIALPIIYLRYSRFRYWITDTELVITSGVLTRQHRNIPLDKIQNVEIVQRLLPRLTGTAQVQVVTAGSSSAEGVLQFVSMQEANRIRQIVRSYSRVSKTAGATEQQMGLDPVRSETTPAFDVPHEADAHETPMQPLYSMRIGRVLLSGAFRFSLLYIALIFSALQFFQPDPEKLAAWVLRSRYEVFVDAIRSSPLSSAVAAILGAAMLSWGSGIVVNINKYFGFRLWKEGSKIGKRSGLLTLAEGSIPLKKIQALVFRTNPIMQFAGWSALYVQTMGLESNESGHRVVVPFARTSETDSVAKSIASWTIPEAYTNVSRKRIMRLFVRYSLLLLTLIGMLSYWEPQAVWLIAASPLLLWTAILQWRNHGYAFVGDSLGVRRGVIKKKTWVVPVSKMQVFYTTDSFFQRRRGLKSVYVDSAGASSFGRPIIIDLESETAEDLVLRLYDRFRLEN